MFNKKEIYYYSQLQINSNSIFEKTILSIEVIQG